MPRRQILNARQRAILFDLPTDQGTPLRHYTLADDDIEHIHSRRRAHNRFGFALQLCVFRYPGRLLQQGEVIPSEITEFLAAQLGLNADDLADYAHRAETRREHLADLRRIYGYKMFTGRGARDLTDWLAVEAETAQSNSDLALRFVRRCRRSMMVVPGVTTVERLCADALVAAERRIETRIVDRLDDDTKCKLDGLLSELVDDRITRFVWLRQFEVGGNSADACRLLERLELLQGFNLKPAILGDIPPHRVSRLRRQGERYFADGLRDISSDRRLAILAVCAIEWAAAISDAVVETHDRIVGKTWREAKKICDIQVDAQKVTIEQTLRSFTELGSALLAAKADGSDLDAAIAEQPGWAGLETLIAQSSKLTGTLAVDPLTHVKQGYRRFRRYAPRMLRALDIETVPVSTPLLKAAQIVTGEVASDVRTTEFLRKTSKWHRHLGAEPESDHRLWEVAVLFHLRDAFRSGDIWLAHSKRYADLKQALVPVEAAKSVPRLAAPFDPYTWIRDRKARLADGLKRLAKAAQNGTIPGGSIKDGILHVDRLKRDVPPEADELVLDLYRRLPDARITDILLDVEEDIGFAEAFTHLRTGVPCADKIGVLNVLLAEGLNLGLSKMAEATSTHDYFQLSRISRWHVESDAINRALAMVVKAQSDLPMARFWGTGMTASSDGQFFPASRQGEAMNLINAKYGNDPGRKAYTHVSDQFGPFATQDIPATVSEALYILDGLLMNEAGRNIKEQYADTGGFTDHVFAVTSLLSYRFIPRIRDLHSKRLYVFDPSSTPQNLRSMIGGKIREKLIHQNWPDILRAVATMASGSIPPVSF